MKVSSRLIPFESTFGLEVPADARVLSLRKLDLSPQAELFMLGDETGPTLIRTFCLVRTGEAFWDSYTFIGSFTDSTGEAFHLFEIFPLKGSDHA